MCASFGCRLVVSTFRFFVLTTQRLLCVIPGRLFFWHYSVITPRPASAVKQHWVALQAPPPSFDPRRAPVLQSSRLLLPLSLDPPRSPQAFPHSIALR